MLTNFLFKGRCWANEEVDYREAAKNGGSLNGSTTTDGENVIINFATIKNSISNDGELSSLYHETEHGVQFEHGEIGFARKEALRFLQKRHTI